MDDDVLLDGDGLEHKRANGDGPLDGDVRGRVLGMASWTSADVIACAGTTRASSTATGTSTCAHAGVASWTERLNEFFPHNSIRCTE